MKKVLLAFIILVGLTGCTKINNLSLDQIVNNTIETKVKLSNQYRTGYKYYLPRGLSVINQSDYNEKINTDRYSYYLYVDVVSYYNKVKSEFKVNNSAYYSKAIKHDKNFGYLEIKPINDKYLVEIMYNYAKIEVIVEKEDINKSVTNAMIVLSTITYTDDIVKNLLSIDEVTSSEEKFSVFDEDASDSNFLEVYKEYGNYEGDDKVPDLDVIK